MIEEINNNIDLEKLQKLFYEAWESSPWTNTFPTVQSAISVSKENPLDLLDACGGNFTAEKELLFSDIHEKYKNTYLEKIVEELKIKVYRLRWMILWGKGCYSFHMDWTRRIHIPIITNPQSFLICKESQEFFHLYPGKAYIVDTKKTHSAMNGHSTWRVHLVGCVDE